MEDGNGHKSGHVFTSTGFGYVVCICRLEIYYNFYTFTSLSLANRAVQPFAMPTDRFSVPDSSRGCEDPLASLTFSLSRRMT